MWCFLFVLIIQENDKHHLSEKRESKGHRGHRRKRVSKSMEASASMEEDIQAQTQNHPQRKDAGDFDKHRNQSVPHAHHVCCLVNVKKTIKKTSRCTQHLRSSF